MPDTPLSMSSRRQLRLAFQKALTETSRHRDSRAVFSRWLQWCMARDLEDKLLDQVNIDTVREEQQSTLEQAPGGPIDESRFETLRTLFDAWWAAADQPMEGRDMLGRVYMDAVLGKKTRNQFFTPWTAARLIAGMTVPGDDDHPPYRRFLDPACGAGVLTLAATVVLAERGLDLPTRAVFVAWDIDVDCSRMAWLQLMRADVPAVVVNGDSLTGDIWQKWGTPALSAFIQAHGTDPLTQFSPDVVLANPPFGAKPDLRPAPAPR